MESFSEIEKYADDLIHVHFASQGLRKLPKTDSDWQFVEKWMRLLKKIGYDGVVCFEGSSEPAESVNNMLIELRKIAEKVGCVC